MNVVILDRAERAEEFAAAILLSQIRNEPFSKLGLATGRTMEGIYSHLVQANRDGLDFSQLLTFNLDEYVDLSPIDVCSYRYYMNEYLFDETNIEPENTFIPRGNPISLQQEVQEFRNKLREVGSIDVQLLGIGENGHIGFNEPPSLFGSETRVVTLSDETRMQNLDAFGGVLEDVPKRAITMGIKTILEAKKLVLVATGRHKSQAVHDAVEGPLRASLPASAIQLHHDVWVILDEAAAQDLNLTAYYRSHTKNNQLAEEYRTFITKYMR